MKEKREKGWVSHGFRFTIGVLLALFVVYELLAMIAQVAHPGS